MNIESEFEIRVLEVLHEEWREKPNNHRRGKYKKQCFSAMPAILKKMAALQEKVISLSNENTAHALTIQMFEIMVNGQPKEIPESEAKKHIGKEYLRVSTDYVIEMERVARGLIVENHRLKEFEWNYNELIRQENKNDT